MSNTRSTPMISATPSSGSPTAFSTIAIVNRPAEGIAAAPTAASVAVTQMRSICIIPSSTP